MAHRARLSLLGALLAAHAAHAQAPAARPLEGAWQGSLSGGPIAATATWTFRGDRYEMQGYPSIAEQGTFALTADVRAADGTRALTLRFTAVRGCGPCSGLTPTLTARPDLERRATLSADGQSLTLNNFPLRRR
ncbi:MAG: hypothetical protein U0325_06620 [Polyangiales bacterium]